MLSEGIDDTPPANKLRDRCREHKREYYDARLTPWADHMTALAHAFGVEHDGWTKVGDVKRAIEAADEYGDSVDDKTATRVIKELRDNGYVEVRQGACRPALPSLTSHFQDMRRASSSENEVVRAVRVALSVHDEGRKKP